MWAHVEGTDLSSTYALGGQDMISAHSTIGGAQIFGNVRVHLGLLAVQEVLLGTKFAE